MKAKAKVEILQERVAERNLIVETDVEIRGIVRRRTYVMDKDSTNAEIQKNISDSIIKESKESFVGKSFEVEIV